MSANPTEKGGRERLSIERVQRGLFAFGRMVQERDSRLDVHTVAFGLIDKAHEIAQFNCFNGVTAVEIEGIVTFFSELQERAGPSGKPATPGALNTQSCLEFVFVRYNMANFIDGGESNGSPLLCMGTAPLFPGKGFMAAPFFRMPLRPDAHTE